MSYFIAVTANLFANILILKPSANKFAVTEKQLQRTRLSLDSAYDDVLMDSTYFDTKNVQEHQIDVRGVL